MGQVPGKTKRIEKGYNMAEVESRRIRNDFPNILAKNHGHIGAACHEAGISRVTYYNWRHKYPEFAAECDKVDEIQISIIEDILYEEAYNRVRWAVELYLKGKHKERYGHIDSNKANTQVIMQLPLFEEDQRIVKEAFNHMKTINHELDR